MQALLAEPRAHLTERFVKDTFDLSGGAKVRHGVDVLDATDTPTGETIPTESGSVTWSYRPPDSPAETTTAVAEVRRRAELTLAGFVSVELITRRYRLWTEFAAADGTWVRSHLGVFVPTIPDATDDGVVVRRRLDLADKSWRYKNRVLTDPLVVPAGTNPVTYVRADLGSRFGETRFAITDTAVVLDRVKVFEPGDSWLDVYNGLLELAGYDQLTVDEGGRPQSVPLAFLAGKGPEYEYAPGAGKIVTAGSVESLLPSLPNVVRFVASQGPALPEEGNGIITRRNEHTGPGSITARGDEVHLEVQVEAENNAELVAVADADAQRYFAGGGLRFSGSVGLNPLHGDRDVVALNKPRLGLSGTWLVTSWSYPLHPVTADSAVLMSLTAEARVA